MADPILEGQDDLKLQNQSQNLALTQATILDPGMSSPVFLRSGSSG